MANYDMAFGGEKPGKRAGCGAFFCSLLHAATSAHILHLQTKSFAEHMALDTLYKDLPGLVDDLIEAYQGEYGIETDYPSGWVMPKGKPLAFVESVKSYVETTRQVVGDKSELQNLVDEIDALLDQTVYKLKFLS